MQAYRKPILGLSAIQSATFVELFQDYRKELAQAGYNPCVARLHLRSVAHFGVWLELQGVALESIDEQTVATFDRHRSSCRCPGTSRDCGRHVVSCIRVFLNHLRERRFVKANAPPEPSRLVREFLGWMSTQRGVVDTTLTSYRRYVTHLVDSLGDDPQTYTAHDLRDFVAKRYQHYGRNSIRMVLAAVRMFLRYLAMEGRCRPGLEQALMSPANWSQHSLPRGLTSQQVQSILAACPSTPRGIRDRAILLLLIRLGLRAGDVAALCFSDLSFETATIRVSGKGGREVRLPLPQDVGDALLAYLDTGRAGTKRPYLPPLHGSVQTVHWRAGRTCGHPCRKDGLEARWRSTSDWRGPCIPTYSRVPNAASGRRARRYRGRPAPSIDRDDRPLRQGGSATS